MFRWMASPAAIRVVASVPMTARLALTPHWILRPSTLEVHTTEGRVGTYQITPGVTIITPPFALQPGENLVRLIVPEGNLRPAEVYAGSRDARQLAVAFRQIRLD
ncbi:MAG: hypothetical protein ACE5LU_02915 [Anaerolineae bacterium]